LLEGILGFQIFIVVTLGISRLFGKNAILTASIAWTVFTLVMVFATPLILLQLLVIWVTYSLLVPTDEKTAAPTVTVLEESAPQSNPRAPRKPREPADDSLGRTSADLPNEGSRHSEAVTKHRQTSAHNRPQRKSEEAANPSAERNWAQMIEAGAKHLERRVDDWSKSVERAKIVQEAICSTDQSFYAEKTLITGALESAKQEVQIERLYEGDPQRLRRFRELHAELEGSIDRSQKLKTINPTQITDPGVPADPVTAEEIKASISSLRTLRDNFLKETVGTLRTDQRLAIHFWRILDEWEQPLIRDHLKALCLPTLKTSGTLAALLATIKTAPNQSNPTKSENDKPVTAAPARKVIIGDRGTIHFAGETPVKKQDGPQQVSAETESESARTNQAPMQLAERIKLRAEQREIPYLTHFTRVENIPSIMQHGLRSVSALRAEGVSFSRNDDQRLDRHPNAISLSVAHPNDKLFFRWQRENPEQRWVVLLFDIDILWQLDCAFCSHNAADRRIRRIEREALSTVEAFEAMFAEPEDEEIRASQSLQPCDPTDVQAEILVFEEIPASMLRVAIFSDHASLTQWRSHLPNRILEVDKAGIGVFGARSVLRRKRRN
jgi:hypothetical protein